jgi:hypothetical protein
MIEDHFRVFRAKLPAYLPAYRAMGLFTVNLAMKKDTLTSEREEIIINLLKGEESLLRKQK